MATFRTAVQRAYDAVGDPEKEGVNQDDITDILSRLGYSSEDRETQNILSQAATMTSNNQNMKFQEVFKLVVGRNEEETLADITNAFEIFDRDDDGKLQTKDLHRWVLPCFVTVGQRFYFHYFDVNFLPAKRLLEVTSLAYEFDFFCLRIWEPNDLDLFEFTTSIYSMIYQAVL